MEERPAGVETDVDPIADTIARLPLVHLIGALIATLLPFICGAGALVFLSGALFGLPEFTISETTYSGTWVLVRFGPALLILGGMAGAIALGTWTEKPWTRGLVIAFWTFCMVFLSAAAFLHPASGKLWIVVALYCLPMLPISWLYLYRWGRVVVYYQSLQANGATDDSE